MAIRGGFGMFYDTSHNATFAAWAGQIGNPLLPGGLLMNIASNNATLNPYCLGNTRCAGGVPADLQTALRAGDGLRPRQQHRAEPGGHLGDRERRDDDVAGRGGLSHPA